MKIITYFTPASLLLIPLIFTSPVHADESPYKWLTERNFYYWLADFGRTKGVAPVTNELYADECGACHFPYQPGLLPEQSWKKIFDAKQLDDHFDDNAELDEDVREALLKYAIANSADKSWYKRSRKIMASLEKSQYPLRITELPYIKKKHREIPIEQIRDNKKVNSLSYCDNCHTKASQGIYDDDTVSIP